MELNEKGKMAILEKAIEVAKAAGEGGRADHPDTFAAIIEQVYKKAIELIKEF